jgi:hypothetical protein
MIDVRFGQKQTFASQKVISALPLKVLEFPLWAKADIQAQFDHNYLGAAICGVCSPIFAE